MAVIGEFARIRQSARRADRRKTREPGFTPY
jgi:hypothetical protein